MAEIRPVTLAPRNLENLLKVQGLRCTDHVPNGIRFQIVDAIVNRGEICRRVIKSAIPFANDAWFIGQFGIIAEEDNHRVLADFGNARFEQAFDHAGQAIVVKTFAALEVITNAEPLVDVLEILH